MEKTALRNYQVDAINAVASSITAGEKRIVLHMASGTGVSSVMLVLVEQLLKKHCNILILSSRISEKELFQQRLCDSGIVTSWQIREHTPVAVVTYQWARQHKEKIKNNNYGYIFCLDALSSAITDVELGNTDTVFIGITSTSQNCQGLFGNANCVYRYTFDNAIRDGYLTPMHDPTIYNSALEAFCKRLFERFAYQPEENDIIVKQSSPVDFCFLSNNNRVWVECKSYRNRYIPPQPIDATTSRLSAFRHNKNIPNTDVVLLMILGEVPDTYKANAYTQKSVLIWDIANLLYYCQHDSQLLDELSRLTFFSPAGIKAIPSPEWNAKLLDNIVDNSLDIKKAASSLKIRLDSCEAGKGGFAEYEKICQDVIDFLFKDAFSGVYAQRQTEDNHYRMDLIAPLRGTNEKTHPIWKMIEHHYNSHFVVFECKNYVDVVNQNQIYITEKYLFNAALRNVAFVLSRKGFSESAHFAACGCLKENGKLILDIHDSDLEKMLQAKSNGDDPADYLLTLLEKFLMDISK